MLTCRNRSGGRVKGVSAELVQVSRCLTGGRAVNSIGTGQPTDRRLACNGSA